MQGDLATTTAADVCRQLAATSADGTLAIAGPDGPATIVFEHGAVIAATSPSRLARLGDRLVGAGVLADDDLARALDEQEADPGGRRLGAILVDGGYVPHDTVRAVVREQVLDALFETLRWRAGTFDLRSDVPTVIPEVGIVLQVDEMLVEISRRQREWDELSRVIAHLDVVPGFASGATSASASLQADEFTVLASIDGQRTIRELADDLGYGEFEAARIVYGLTLLGIVEIQPTEDEVGLLVPGPGNAEDAAELGDGVAHDQDLLDQDETEQDEADRGEAVDAVDAAAMNGVAAVGDTDAATPPTFAELIGELSSLRDAPPKAATEDADADDDDVDASGEPVASDAADDPAVDAPAVDTDEDGADVREFLRELSRLALDEGADAPAAPPRQRREEPVAHEDDGKRKRRGLFGWGG